MSAQLSHTGTSFDRKSFPIVLVCDNITGAANVGSLFRTADAFGVSKILFCGKHLPEFGKRMQRTARSTEKAIPFEFHEDINDTISTLRQDHTVIALEIADQSTPIHSFDFNIYQSMALVIGNENFGVSSEILSRSDAIVHIDMFGQNSSMNVTQATTIALFEITRQWGDR